MFQSLTLYFHPRILTVLALGVASGLPLALTGATLGVWLTEAGVSMSAVGFFVSATTPYAFKFVWAPLVDQMPIPLLTRLLGQRRAWLVTTQILLTLALLALGLTDPAHAPWFTALCAFVVACLSATQDIVIDAYRVEILKEEEQGAGAAAVVLGYRLGMLLSGAGALALSSYVSWFVTYAVMAALLWLGTLAVMLKGEPEREIKTGPRRTLAQWLKDAVVAPFAQFAGHKGWVYLLLFAVLYKFGDAFAGVMTNPFLLETGFSKTEIAGIVKTFGLFATIGGALIGGALVHRIGIMKSLWLCGVLQMLGILVFAAQARMGHDPAFLAFAIAMENGTSGMGTAAFVAFLSRLCHVSYTATQYALLSSLASFGRTLLSSGSGVVAETLGWEGFFLFATAMALPGLLLLRLVQKYAMERPQ